MKKLLAAVLALVCLVAVVAVAYGLLVGSWTHAVIEVVVALMSGTGVYVLTRSRTAPKGHSGPA